MLMITVSYLCHLVIIILSSINVLFDLKFLAPLKGIPSRNSFGSSSSFKTPNPVNRSAISVRNPTRPTIPGVRRDGGIKLLDIKEQPLGRDAKRKKRNQEEPETVKQKENEKAAEAEQTATPDYAVGLTSLIPPSPAPSYSVPQSSTSTVPDFTLAKTPVRVQPINNTIRIKQISAEEATLQAKTTQPNTIQVTQIQIIPKQVTQVSSASSTPQQSAISSSVSIFY